MDKITAPWNESQVYALQRWQAGTIFPLPVHPYTCGNDSNHQLLIPLTSGWVCPDCDYTQDWALDPIIHVDPELLNKWGIQLAED